MKIGVIAEEYNDIGVLYHLTCKLAGENTFSFNKFVGHGCGKLRRKCGAWAANLIRRGCSCVVIIHDLDRYDEPTLRQNLSNAIRELSCSSKLILIPVHEIEAWLLTDAKALQEVFKLKSQPDLPNDPELIPDAKEKLKEILWKEGKKAYINTIHNEKIAAKINIARVKTCKSFRPYPEFVSKYLKPTTEAK